MLDRRLCQVGGLNQNYTSGSGTLYHIQIEDRGPVLDRLTEQPVRRINMIVYANYGEADAHIVYSHDHDLPDTRTTEHNRLVQQTIQELAADIRQVIEDKEQRQVMRIKCLIREYYYTKGEAAKREFEQANAAFPFLFSRAWKELRGERQRPEGLAALASLPEPAPAEAEVVAPPEEVAYPLEVELRELVLDIERVIIELARDLHKLRLLGKADDILLQTCRKLVARAKESISGREPSEFNARRLDMTRNSLMTTWRQVRSRLKAAEAV